MADLDAPGSARPSNVTSSRSSLTHPVILMRKKARNLSEEALSELVRAAFRTNNRGQEPRPLQISSVVALACGLNTFVLAGTGYGKTRIAESFIRLYTAVSKAIILAINPLDALGDNQASHTGLNTQRPQLPR